MGATEFYTTYFGKNASDAFQAARTDALHEHGHEGYTGSIAEKSDFTEFELPARVSVEKVMSWVRREMDAQDVERSYPDSAARADAAEKYRKTIPAKHRGFVRRVAGAYDDKWGPAVCFKLWGKASRELRARSGFKGRRGQFYVFCGFASE